MRLRTYRFSDIGSNSYYYDDYENEYYTKIISEKCYLPANKIILDLIHRYRSKFKVSYLFSGVVLDQFELYAPEVLKSIKSLINTGFVCMLSGGYSNSACHPAGNSEFNEQMILQNKRIKHLFRKNPVVFPGSNIFLSCSTRPEIRLFFVNLKSEDKISSGSYVVNLNGRSPVTESLIPLLNDDHRNDDNIAVLFIPYTLSADYQNTSLNEFLQALPEEIFSRTDYSFADPSEISDNLWSELLIEHGDSINNENFAWPFISFNELQRDAFEKLYSLKGGVVLCNDPAINKDWLYLQSFDHFYFMDSDLYEENSGYGLVIPYESPYFAYINYMNILDDFSKRMTMPITDETGEEQVLPSEQRNIAEKSNWLYEFNQIKY